MAISLRNLGPTMPAGTDLMLPNSDTMQMRLAQQDTLRAIGNTNLAFDAAFFAPATVLSMADTFLQSFGVLSERDMEDFLNEYAAPFGKSFERSRGASQVLGDLTGMFIPAMAAAKAVRVGGFLEKGATRVFGEKASRFFSTGKSNTELFQANYERARLLGTQRVKNLDSPSLGFAMARRKAIGRSVADTLIEGVAADAAVAVSMRSSDFLFPDEMSLVDNLGWFAGTNAIVGMGAGLIAKQVMKTGIREAYAAGRVASSTKADWVAQMSPSNIVGMRGASIAVHSVLLDEAKHRLTTARAVSDNETMVVANEEITGIQKQLGELTRYSFQDSPIEGVTRSFNFRAGDAAFSPYLKTMQAVYDHDPKMAFGLRSLETFDQDANVGFQERYSTTLETLKVTRKEIQHEIDGLVKLKRPTTRDQKKLQRLRNKIGKIQTQLDDVESTVAIVAEIDGTTSALSGRAAIWQDGQRDVIKFARAGAGVETEGKMLLASFDGNLTIGPKKKDITFDLDDTSDNILSSVEKVNADTWKKFSHMQRTAAFDALQSAAERVNIATWTGVELKGRPHFTQLDYLLDVVATHGDAALKKIQGVDTVDDLRFASLASKFEEFQIMRREASQAMAKKKEHVYTDLNNVARALNLPTTDYPLVHLFESLRVSDPDILMKLEPIAKSMEGMQAMIKMFKGIEDPAELAGMKWEGSMLQMARDRKPVLAVMRNMENRAALTAEDLRTHVATIRATQAETLRRAKGTVVVQNVMQEMDGLQQTVSSLRQNLQSTVHGISGFGIAERNVAQQSFRFRDEPAFQAARTIADVTEKRTDKAIEFILKSKSSRNPDMSVQDVFNRVVAPGNEAHLDSFFTLRHALGAGWDLAPQNKFVRVASNAANRQGVYQVVLDGKSERNKVLWKNLFDEEFPEGDSVFLPIMDPRNGTRSAVTVTEMAMDTALEMNRLSQQLLKEENAMRKARNMRALPRKDFHLPPIDFSRAHREYLFDNAGNFVSVVGADTKGELAQLVKKEIEASNGKLISLTEADVERFHGSRAEAFFKMVNFSRPSNQTASAKGTSFGNTIRTGSNEFHGMLESVLRGYSDIGRSMRMMLLDPEIQYVKMMKNSSGIADNVRSSYDELITTIAGTQNVDTNTVVGKTLTATEQVYDRLIQTLHDGKIAANELLSFSGRNERRGTTRFDALEKELFKQFNPFQSVDDYLVRTNNTGVAPTLRKHSALLNETVAALSIRMFDIGMGVINLLSVAATLPPVIAMLGKRIGESDNAHMSRIGVFGTVTPKGNKYFSPVKASITGVAFRNTDEGKEVLARAAKRGFLDQAAAEQTEIWGRTGESFVTNKLRDFSNKVSKFTDWTERESRTIAFSTFYKIGRDGLGLQDNAAMLFAHQQANNTIADFRPANRPAIFQGAAGMPLGLFTTYMWNYWQRVVTMVENKQVRSGAWLAGLQGSLFGAESLPGWDLYTGLFMENYDGSHNVVDRFNEAFGHTTADLFLNGSLSNLPRMFGAEDGISIGPRASVGVPFESGFGAQSVAGIRMLTRVGSTVGNIIDSTIEQGGIDPTRVGEILATANINKFMTNVLDLAIGHSVDYTGNIIESDTFTPIGVAARVAGFKPLMADELRQENVRNRSTDRIQAELKDRLAENLKSRIRNGKLNNEDVETALEHYARAGGNPESFRRFFQSQILRATTNKVDLEIVDALRGSIDEGRIGRLLYLSKD